jgi:hypothetical protein
VIEINSKLDGCSSCGTIDRARPYDIVYPEEYVQNMQVHFY